MNETLDTIINRSSLRRFSKEEVTLEKKKLIIESALRAPTAGNLMLYSIIKVEDKGVLEKLSHTCDEQPFIKTASFALIFLVDFQKLYDYFANSNFLSYCKEQGQEPVYPSLSDLLLGSQDAIAAAQNSVIAAESLGVGSCYIGDIIEHYETHKEMFHLEDLSFPLGMLVFGNYPKDYKRVIRNRFDSKYVVFDETYKKLNDTELKDMFKEREESFIPGNKLGAKNAAQYIYGLKFGSEFGKEMQRSVNLAFERWMSEKNKDINKEALKKLS